MSLIRKSLISASAAIAMTGGRFLLIVILARRLSTAEFGQFVYAQWLVDTSFLICAFGVNGLAARYLAEYAHDASRRAAFLRQWFPWALMLPVLSGFLAVVGAMLFGLSLSPRGYALLAAWAMATGWWAMQTAALTGDQRFGLVLKANLVYIGTVIPAAVLLPVENGFLDLLLCAMTVASLLACLVGSRQIAVISGDISPCDPAALPWPTIRSYALNIWLTALLWGFVWSRGEMPLVRTHLGDEGVAQYTVVLTLFFGAMQGIMLWVGGVASHLTSELGSGRKAEAIRMARNLSDVQLLLSGCAGVLLTCFGPEMLGLIFGPGYRASVLSLGILAISLITLSASAQNHLLQIETDARFNRNTSLAGLAILYAIAAFTVPWLGVVGAAIARALTMWSLFFLSLFFVWRAWGRVALSGRNAGISLFVLSVPLIMLGLFDGDLLMRTAIAFVCLAALALLLRHEDGRQVGINVIFSGWSHLQRRVLGDRKAP